MIEFAILNIEITKFNNFDVESQNFDFSCTIAVAFFLTDFGLSKLTLKLLEQSKNGF